MYHGRMDRGEPEWPPSPLRLFQALVAAATDGGAGQLTVDATNALRWLERQLPPTIVAPAGVRGTGYRLSVPNNAMDIVARAWCRGIDSTTGDANPTTHRTMKTVRATHVEADRPVHFQWPVSAEATPEATLIANLARRVVALGWGVDLVVADGALVNDDQVTLRDDGVAWTATRDGAGVSLRVPVAGTLDDVLSRHSRFLTRLASGTFDPPPPLAAYATVSYQPMSGHQPQARAVFSLLNVNGTGFKSFETVTRALTVAGMTRHATRVAAERSKWPDDRIHQFVLGHGEPHGGPHRPVSSPRFAYVPLPSIESRSDGEVVGSVRRVMLTVLGGQPRGEIAWVSRALPGQSLVSQRDGTPSALLGALPKSDAVTGRYTGTSSIWTSVTPVVLPGYDDPAHYRRRLARGTSPSEQKSLLTRLDSRIDGLLRKAIVQAGFSTELADHADIEWRRVGWIAGTEPVERYGVPDHLKRFTRLHVRIEWRDREGPVNIAGPCVLGSGRFYGLGLLATGGSRLGV
jgi:CRISPR-associated protein Csb2